jgi:Na+-transporting methylmalonyl-CoA/oxaloacetate decarboxylase gamma subunit
MYLVAIAWLYVALMMAVAEAMHPGGTVLGAIFTLLMYGIGPVALVLYLLGTPMRAKARRRAEQASVHSADKAPSTVVAQPDEAGHAAGDAVATVREEP